MGRREFPVVILWRSIVLLVCEVVFEKCGTTLWYKSRKFYLLPGGGGTEDMSDSSAAVAVLVQGNGAAV
jgi:hypothetical protein